MSKKVICPSCEMRGDPKGDDYSLVTTYHRRPVLQCFWCDSRIMIRKLSGALVLDLNHKAIRHLRPDLDHEEMVSLLLDDHPEAGAESASVAEILQPAASEPMALGPFEPELTDEPVRDNAPVLLRAPDYQTQTPVGTQTELVSNIPLDARALDHDALIHMSAQIGWVYSPVYKKPEWMNFEMPAPVQMSPRRAKIQNTINMFKYFRINAGSREQRRAEAVARRQRLVEYRRRMFDQKLQRLQSTPAIEYKPETV